MSTSLLSPRLPRPAAVLSPHDKRFTALANLASTRSPLLTLAAHGGELLDCYPALPSALAFAFHGARVLHHAASARRGESAHTHLKLGASPRHTAGHVGGAVLLAASALCAIGVSLTHHVAAAAKGALAKRLTYAHSHPLEQSQVTASASSASAHTAGRAASSKGDAASSQGGEQTLLETSELLPEWVLKASLLTLLKLAAESREWQVNAHHLWHPFSGCGAHTTGFRV